MEPCTTPIDAIIEQEHLVGLTMQRTAIQSGKVVPIPNSEYEVRSPLVIASIGSIPEPILGIPMNWETYQVDQEECCRIEGYPNAFVVGNAVTGRGNILESLKHGREIGTTLSEHLLDTTKQLEQQIEVKEKIISVQITKILLTLPPLDATTYQSILPKIKSLQRQAQYNGDYMEWVKKNLPIRLETILGEQ